MERNVLFGGSRGSGKSAWMVNEGIALSLDYPGNVGFIGRWESTTFKRTTLITLMNFLPSELIKHHSTYESRIIFYNGSIIYYGGLKPTQAVNLLDKYKGLDLGWFGIDEASEVPEQAFLMFSGGLRLPLPHIHYRALLTSNPEPGWVYQRFIRKQLPDHRFIGALPHENPHNPSDYEDKLRELYPADWVKRYVEGIWEFDENNDFHLFSYSSLTNAMERDIVPMGEINFGVDFARKGKDSTVISCSQGGHNTILYKCAFNDDLMPVVGIIGSFIKDMNPKHVICDAVGLGVGAYDRLRELFGEEIIKEFIGGSTAANPNKFKNSRAEGYWHLKELLDNGEMDLPNDDSIRGQAAGIKYKIYSDSKIIMQSKDEMESSPDEMDAIMMANSGSIYSDGIIGRVMPRKAIK